VFVWLTPEVLADSTVVTFATADDYVLGVLHSKIHETWARATGSQLREEESGFRYTATSTFETFPFPAVTEAQRSAIAAAARELDAERQRWLNPPEWLRDERIAFPATTAGPWAHRVNGAGAARAGRSCMCRSRGRLRDVRVREADGPVGKPQPQSTVVRRDTEANIRGWRSATSMRREQSLTRLPSHLLQHQSELRCMEELQKYLHCIAT